MSYTTWGYVIFDKQMGPGTGSIFVWSDDLQKALDTAIAKARKEHRAQYVAKVELTHEVGAPQVTQPEVKRFNADAGQSG